MKNGLILNENGTKFWYLNDVLHRVECPAIIRPSGVEYWYLNGVLMSKENHAAAVAEMQLKES